MLFRLAVAVCWGCDDCVVDVRVVVVVVCCWGGITISVSIIPSPSPLSP